MQKCIFRLSWSTATTRMNFKQVLLGKRSTQIVFWTLKATMQWHTKQSDSWYSLTAMTHATASQNQSRTKHEGCTASSVTMDMPTISYESVPKTAPRGNPSPGGTVGKSNGVQTFYISAASEAVAWIIEPNGIKTNLDVLWPTYETEDPTNLACSYDSSAFNFISLPEKSD